MTPAIGSMMPPAILNRVVKVKSEKISFVNNKIGQCSSPRSGDCTPSTDLLATFSRPLEVNAARTGGTSSSCTVQSAGGPVPLTRLTKPGGHRPGVSRPQSNSNCAPDAPAAKPARARKRLNLNIAPNGNKTTPIGKRQLSQQRPPLRIFWTLAGMTEGGPNRFGENVE